MKGAFERFAVTFLLFSFAYSDKICKFATIIISMHRPMFTPAGTKL